MVGNKYDLLDKLEVSEEEGRSLAKEINAIFSLVSAKENFGINNLFKNIGNKFLEENWNRFAEENEKSLEELREKRQLEQKIFKRLMKYMDY